MTTQIQPTDLIIAPPHIPDRRFRGTVIMITHDHSGGTFGLCLNRETKHALRDIMEDTGLESHTNFPLYWGGPVSPGTVWMLHSRDWAGENTVEISDQWAMTSSVQMFEAMGQGDHPRQFRLFYGFCSWAPGQLQNELNGQAPWRREHSWLVAQNLGPDWVMEQPVENLWESATTLSSHQAVDSWL